MKTKITLFIALCFSLGIFAQEFTTPDSGVNWTLEDLMEESEETVEFVDNTYIIKQDIMVSKNDTLTFNSGENINIDAEVLITVSGNWLSLGEEENLIKINATDSLTPYEGFRLQDEAVINIDYTSFKNGGGLRVITPNLTLTNSIFEYNTADGVNTSSTVNISNGAPLIENNRFYKNDLSAIASGANVDAAPKILNNHIEANSQNVENRPQINLGSSGGETIEIVGNTIIGDRDLTSIGGISVANLLGGELNALIENNTIQDNRYGINIQGGGNAYVEVVENIIEDNDTEGNPALGGSGISMTSASSSQVTVVTGNEIRGNLWGITVINEATANLGDEEDNPGNNIFSENGNGGETYALYNNTPNTIMAKNNCWIEGEESTLEEVAEVIFDQEDDESLGEVIYDPINCGVMGLPSFEKEAISMFPNPAKDQLNFETSVELDQIEIFDINGRKVQEFSTSAVQNSIDLNLDSGVYFVLLSGENGQLTKKLIVK